jgi:SAM-dependent methyltransferase
MRGAANAYLAGYARFHSVEGTAEATTLADHSVGFVTAGQAFHWFEPTATRREFVRILRPGGWVVLVWNERKRDGSAFARAYEALVRRFGTDYAKVVHRENASLVGPFFAGERGFQKRTFDHVHTLDFDGLRGRLASSSYIPRPGHDAYDAMIAELRTAFDAHQVEGRVRMEYDTDVYFGQLG